MKRLQKGEDGNSNSIDRISGLPHGILQRILYFLSQKEVAQTCVLSKSWRYIWCTRPNLDFSDFLFNGNKQLFLSVVDKTLQRYCDQMLCVDEFHLCMALGDPDHGSVSLLEKWIPTLTNMGMKEFYLYIRSEQHDDDDDDDDDEGSVELKQLPSVVFGAESLRYLHVEEFMLDENAIERIVLFKRLKTLHLNQVCIEDEVFQKIISSCPLIETLSLMWCVGLRTIKLNDVNNLKGLYFSLEEEHCSIEIQYPQSLETVDISGDNIYFRGGYEFRNLNALYLHGVKSSLDHLSSCKFPILKFLTLFNCDGLKGIELFIDAPNMKIFNYTGGFIPSISFATTTTSNEWDSTICMHSDDASSSWFLKLKELLRSLSQSNISLITKFEYPMIDTDEHIIQENHEHVVVYSLEINCNDLHYFQSILNRFFRICRPRNIGDYICISKKEVVEYLWKILMQREIGDSLDLFRHELWLQDLEQVTMEIYDTDRKEWRTLTSRNYQEPENIATRFALKWRNWNSDSGVNL